MRIADERLKALKELMLRDYGVELTDAEAEKLGLSMLRVYRLAATALARTEAVALEPTVHAGPQKKDV
jgi:hypothetical protein